MHCSLPVRGRALWMRRRDALVSSVKSDTASLSIADDDMILFTSSDRTLISSSDNASGKTMTPSFQILLPEIVKQYSIARSLHRYHPVFFLPPHHQEISVLANLITISFN